MHIITKKRLLQASVKYPSAKAAIAFWHNVAKAAVWSNFVATRKSFGHADQVKVKSGRIVTVFNLAKSYRLITAIHYNRKKIFILRFLTHPDYEKGEWKLNL